MRIPSLDYLFQTIGKKMRVWSLIIDVREETRILRRILLDTSFPVAVLIYDKCRTTKQIETPPVIYIKA